MLNLYLGITPNYESTYYYFSNFANYLTFLSTKLLKQIEPSAFTINYNRVRVRIDNELTINNYKSVTYIVNTDDEKCYLVNNAIVQSGYVDFNITVDNWGTYINKASFKDILVQRCNRRISDYGVYDEVTNVTNVWTETALYRSDTINIQNLGIVISAQIGNGGVFNLGCKASDLLQALSEGQTITPSTVFAYFIRLGTATKIGTTLLKYDCSILNVWLIPYECLSFSTSSSTLLLNNVNLYNGDTEISFNNALKLLSYKQTTKEYSTLGGSESTPLGQTKDAIMLGTKYNGLLLKQTTGISSTETEPRQAKIIYTVSSGDLSVKVFDGIKNTMDITQAFTFVIATSASAQTSQMKTAKALGVLSSLVQLGTSVVTKRFARTPSSIIGLLGSINDASTPPSSNFGLRGDGDATSTYGITDSTYSTITSVNFCYPIQYTYATSYVDEDIRHAKLGATFNEYIDTIDEIFSKDFLYTESETQDTYLQLDVEIDTIPLDATNEIRDKLKNGVYLQQLL